MAQHSTARDRADAGSLRQAVATFAGHLRPHRGVLVLACAMLAVAGLLGLAQPLASKYVLEALAEKDGLGRSLVALAVLVLLGAVLVAYGNYLLLRIAEAVVATERRSLVGHIVRLTMPAVRRYPPGDLLSRVTADTSLLRHIATQLVVQVLTGGIMLVGALGFMAWLDLTLLIATVVVVALLGVVVGVALPRIRNATRGAQDAVGELGSTLERVLGAFSTVKGSNAEAAEERRIAATIGSAYAEGVRLARWTSLAGTVAGLAIQVAFLVVLGFGGARVVSGTMSPADLVAFLLYVVYLAQPLAQLTSAGAYFQMARAAISRVDEVHQLPVEQLRLPASASGRPTGIASVTSIGGGGAVRFDRVTFTYPDRTTPALRDVSFDIPTIGLTAIVGPSGAGKSTILNLIERFYEADRGRVQLDGLDVCAWHLAALRAQIGYVEQDPAILAGTLRENLTYAAPDATETQMFEALRVTRLQPLMERLGFDLDAPVNYRGTSLSGGERQRIAIARVLLRQPRVLLLDEPTSQLDAVNEAALREVIQDLATRTGIVVVAHRLSTVVSADRIIVMDGGEVQSIGRHHELLRDDPLYSSLVAGQLLQPAGAVA